FPRHRQTPNHLKRVTAHADWREPSTSVLDDFFYIGDIRKQESKRTLQFLYCLCSFYVIGNLNFEF
ncbi:MAG: hypothetical protein IKW78_06710, partial [Prevotella sp.]|nr:hypothetical protein [Prevotella sp.]